MGLTSHKLRVNLMDFRSTETVSLSLSNTWRFWIPVCRLALAYCCNGEVCVVRAQDGRWRHRCIARRSIFKFMKKSFFSSSLCGNRTSSDLVLTVTSASRLSQGPWMERIVNRIYACVFVWPRVEEGPPSRPFPATTVLGKSREWLIKYGHNLLMNQNISNERPQIFLTQRVWPCTGSVCGVSKFRMHHL